MYTNHIPALAFGIPARRAILCAVGSMMPTVPTLFTNPPIMVVNSINAAICLLGFLILLAILWPKPVRIPDSTNPALITNTMATVNRMGEENPEKRVDAGAIPISPSSSKPPNAAPSKRILSDIRAKRTNSNTSQVTTCSQFKSMAMAHLCQGANMLNKFHNSCIYAENICK